MVSLEEISNLAENINEQAHQDVWDSWIEADRLEESEDENDWIRAEDQRELASLQQSEMFRDRYFDLTEEEQSAIIYWLEEDEDFREQFQSWFGEEEFERIFNENE